VGNALIGALDVGGELVGVMTPEIERDRPDILRRGRRRNRAQDQQQREERERPVHSTSPEHRKPDSESKPTREHHDRAWSTLHVVDVSS
jgi:hypothetical protein